MEQHPPIAALSGTVESAHPLSGIGPASQWQERLAAGRLCVQRCTACGTTVFEPRPFCPQCDALALEWLECSGRAEVHALTVVRRKPDHGGDFGVALVDLAEGVRLMARPHDHNNLAIGDAVNVTVEPDRAGGHWLRCLRVETRP